MAQDWVSSVPISMPTPSEEPIIVPMFGFGYTQYGLVHDIDAADRMNFRRPAMPPADPRIPVVYEDAGLDDTIPDGGAFI
jgi:hypothetical protein